MKHTILENNLLHAHIDHTRGWIKVTDKVSGVVWDHDPWNACPGELVLREDSRGKNLTFDLGTAKHLAVDCANATSVRVTYQDLVSDEQGEVCNVSVHVSISLQGEEPELIFCVEAIEFDTSRFSLDHLTYPLRMGSLISERDQGYLVIPFNQGALIPSGRFQVPLRDEWHQWDDLSWQVSGLAWGTEGAMGTVPIYGWNALSMPWFGVVHGDSAYVAVVETENDAQLNFIANYNKQDDFRIEGRRSQYTRIASLSPRWISTKGRFGYPREIRYRFFARGDHTQMAGFYRTIAERQGLVKTLSEKLEQKPQIERLFGAPMIQIDGGYPWYTDYSSMMYTWKTLQGIAQDLHDSLKVERAFLCTWGGYANLPPESYPFHEAWGSEAELSEAVRYIQDLGYLYCTYHGYPANLPHAKSFGRHEAKIHQDGGIHGRWGGRCSSTFLKYAQSDLPHAIAVSGQMADYTDMVTASNLSECYHPDHALVRTEDRQNRIALLEYIDSLGLVTGSEVAEGYVVPVSDYTKGGMIVGLRYFLLQHIHAPLFSLVFHDCLVQFDGTVGTSRRKEYSNETLECLAYGIQPIFSFNIPHYAGAQLAIQETCALYAPFQKETATEKLTHHTYINGGYDLQRTEFSSGASVTINTDTAPYTDDRGQTIPARGFVIERQGKLWRAGNIATKFQRVE